MLPDGVSNPGPLTFESGALQIAPRGLAELRSKWGTPEHTKWTRNSLLAITVG